MKLTDRRFWIAWTMFLLLAGATIFFMSWNADTAALCGAYALPTVVTVVCRRCNPRVALSNLIIMLLYNAPLSYCLLFKSHGGAGLTWWVFIILLNTLHSLILLIYATVHLRKSKYQ